MHTLERSLIEKAGNDNGWEYVKESSSDQIRLASSRHGCEVFIRSGTEEGEYILAFSLPLDQHELQRGFPADIILPNSQFKIWTFNLLPDFLRRSAELLTSLPNKPLEAFQSALEQELQTHEKIRGTESESLVRARIGQDMYRKALLSYWKGQCAVTGITIPQLLRASHAKPWAECESDAERLNVYNGFLLAAHLDALFDTGLISFTNQGRIIISSQLPKSELRHIGIDQNTTLRWIDESHIPFLNWHQNRVFIQ
jgi:hypothetical protein